MGEVLLAFEGVGLRSSDGRIVFDDLNWSLRKGEKVRIAGARGSGGTAILRLCAGLAHPQKGRVLVDGVPHGPHEFGHPYLRRGAVAWIPEEGGLVANLTLLQNVALPLRFIVGKGREEAERLALSMLSALDLEIVAHQRPHTLSRRDRHLGALARSGVMGAELWLWDRPIDELEGHGLAQAIDALSDVLLAPATTIVVVGDDPQYESFAPAVLHLRGGRLTAEGGT